MKKVAVIAGVGALLLYQSGMLDALINPPEDELEEEEEPDLIDGDPSWDVGDPLALLAISMATRAGLKGAAKAVKAATKVKPAALKVQAVKASAAVKTTVAKAATTATKATSSAAKGGVKVATQATEAAATAATKAATTATKAVGPAAKSAAKSAKGAQLMSKLKGTPADLIVMVIAQVLSAVLDLDPDSFRDCEPGEFDLGKLPDWAQAMIGAVPFLGDLFDLLGNKMCLKAGCPKDTEDSGGLCYPPCKPGFKSDGAIMCYKQYPEFESNGMLGTITSITKKILMDTGRIPSDCAEGEEKIGALCYEKVDGFTNVAGTVWQNCPAGHTDTGVRCEKNWDVGAGRLPRLSDCPAGWNNDGLTCRAPITMSSCNGGDVDDGLLCRVPLRGGNCNTWWDGCASRAPGWLGGGCIGGVKTHCEPITGGNVYHKTLYGGQETRTLLGPAAGEERIDGLDYNKCPDGYSRIPGMPYLCTASFTKQSRVLAPRTLKCPKKADGQRETDIAGLCYSEIPKGYSRKVLGTLDQDCPPGSQDFGVGCTREAYNRGAGLIPLGIRVKDRK